MFLSKYIDQLMLTGIQVND